MESSDPNDLLASGVFIGTYWHSHTYRGVEPVERALRSGPHHLRSPSAHAEPMDRSKIEGWLAEEGIPFSYGAVVPSIDWHIAANFPTAERTVSILGRAPSGGRSFLVQVQAGITVSPAHKARLRELTVGQRNQLMFDVVRDAQLAGPIVSAEEDSAGYPDHVGGVVRIFDECTKTEVFEAMLAVHRVTTLVALHVRHAAGESL